MGFVLAWVVSAHAACTVTASSPADGATVGAAPTFGWAGDCVEYRVLLTGPGAGRFTSPWSSSTAFTPPAAWDTSTGDGVWWAVQGADAAGVRTTTPERWLAVDNDADDDGVDRFTDCDDGDPRVFPGAIDACDDALDADCDGVDPSCTYVPAAEVTLESSARAILRGSPTYAGDQVTHPALGSVLLVAELGHTPWLVLGGPLGHVDKSGVDYEEAGAVWFVEGGDLSREIVLERTRSDAEGDRTHHGAALAAVDFDGDGWTDIAIGSPGGFDTKVEIAHGASTFRPNAYLQSALTDGASEPGGALAPAGDVTGDGREDLFVAASRARVAGMARAGVVHLQPGTSDRESALTSVATLQGDAPGVRLGSLLATGDLDGDGNLDLAVGTADERVLVFYGPVVGTIPAGAASATVTMEVAGDGPATALAIVPDTTGDGLPDLVVGVAGADSGAGAAYVVPLPGGAMSLGTAPIILRGVAGAGSTVAGMADSDGDALAELLIGAADEDAAYLVFSMPAGDYPLGAVGTALRGVSTERAGAGVAAGDLDGDGSPDLVIGAPAARTHTFGSEGAVYVLSILDEAIWDCVGVCDTDGDGFDGLAQRGDDCDDSDPAIAPDAPEVCDGVDNDCDGLVDTADPDLVDPRYIDNDGDGWGSDRTTCREADTATRPGDCNDRDADEHPDQVWYLDGDRDGFGDASDPGLAQCARPFDGLRATNPDDCNDSDPLRGPSLPWWSDADGDGFGDGIDATPPSCAPPAPNTAPSWRSADCDDTTALVSPGAFDTCGNGIDDDCSGDDTICVPLQGALGLDDASAVITGFGADVTAVGDLDGDGGDDLVSGANDALVLTTPLRGSHEAVYVASTRIASGPVSHWLQFAGGDVDGDGTPDLAAQQHDGAVYVFSGPLGSELGPADAAILASDPGLWSGQAPAEHLELADLDGDGAADLLFGSRNQTTAGSDSGSFVIRGPMSGTLTGSDVDLDVGPVASAAAVAGDLDGDGVLELAYADDGVGAVYLVAGDRTGSVDPATSADTVLTGSAGFGYHLAAAGDVDGDGTADLVVSDPEAGAHGRLYVALGAGIVVGATQSVDTVTTSVVVGEAGQRVGLFGTDPKGVGDTDGDGRDDVALGLGNGTSANAVCLLRDAAVGVWSPDDLPVCVHDPAGAFGAGVEGADLDGDGLSDLMISAYPNEVLVFYGN